MAYRMSCVSPSREIGGLFKGHRPSRAVPDQGSDGLALRTEFRAAPPGCTPDFTVLPNGFFRNAPGLGGLGSVAAVAAPNKIACHSGPVIHLSLPGIAISSMRTQKL